MAIYPSMAANGSAEVFAKILYPQPPPTSNTLTAHQRAQLVKRTKKLAKILGTMPRLEEESADLMSPPASPTPSRSSTDSIRSDSSGSAYSFSSYSDSSHSSLPSSLSKSTTTRGSRALTPLRLVSPLSHYSLDGHTSAKHHKSRPSLSHVTHLSAPPSPTEPTYHFTIPTPTAVRKQKMDRLRRVLGEDVPLALVFPAPASDTSDGEAPPTARPTVIELKPTPRPKRAGRKIVHARDSLEVTPPPTPQKPRLRVIEGPRPSRPAPPPPLPTLAPTPAPLSVSLPSRGPLPPTFRATATTQPRRTVRPLPRIPSTRTPELCVISEAGEAGCGLVRTGSARRVPVRAEYACACGGHA